MLPVGFTVWALLALRSALSTPEKASPTLTPSHTACTFAGRPRSSCAPAVAACFPIGCSGWHSATWVRETKHAEAVPGAGSSTG
eukprot:491765-Prorocentrum_minimum.AAC.2